MFKFARIVQGLAREHIGKALTRSGEWQTVRKHFLEKIRFVLLVAGIAC